MDTERLSRLIQSLRERMEPQEDRASLQGTIVREAIALAARHMARGEKQFKPLPELEWRVPAGYTRRVQALRASHLEWILPEQTQTEKVVYQLHGGAYIAPLTNPYRQNAVRLSRLGGGVRVVSLDYRTAPEHVFPNALEDALEGYDAIVREGTRPEDMLLFGDSAGGNLALALMIRLRDEGRALPCGAALVSPWTDLAGEGNSYRDNLYKDPMFGIDEGQDPALAGVATSYAGDTDLHDPLLSPAYAELSGLPPLLIQAGSHEMLLSDSESVAAHAAEAGVDATLTVYEGMFHVFSICCGEMIPEGRAAWQEVKAFMERVLKEQA